MSESQQVIEAVEKIQNILKQIMTAKEDVTMVHGSDRAEFTLVAVEANRMAFGMEAKDFEALSLGSGERVTLALFDRGYKYEGATLCSGLEKVGGRSACYFEMPKSLRLLENKRLAEYAPESPIDIKLTNSRGAQLRVHVTAFGREGVELALKDPKSKAREYFNKGEEDSLEIVQGSLKLKTEATVFYIDEKVAGLRFSEKTDPAALEAYRNWIDTQKRQKAQKSFGASEGLESKPVARQSAELPAAKIWVDKDPMILILSESEEFVRRMADGLGKKFGFMSLDYIKGRVKTAVKEHVGENDCGRIKMVLVHNKLRLASQLEVTKQLVEVEKCNVPVVCVGTDQDVELRRNRAMAVGSVDYIVVEPFKILSVMKKIEDILQMFW